MTPQDVLEYYGGHDESVLQAARELKCSPQAIYNWIKDGEVPRPRQLEIQEQTKGRLKADKLP